MAFRSQPYRIEWPLNAEQAEAIDTMFQVLFDDVRNDSIFPTTTEGDMIYQDDEGIQRLGIGAPNTVLRTDGTVPEWDKVNLGTGGDTTGVVPVGSGGTGQTSFTTGDLLHAVAPTTVEGLEDVATGNVLLSGGIGVVPAYGKVGLTTHVSGTLPIANGGTNATASPTAGGVVYGTGTAYAINSAGTTGQTLLSGGAGAPTWGTAGMQQAQVMTRVVLGI